MSKNTAPETYLDCNATSPVLPEALGSAIHAMQVLYGNPSSSHVAGASARAMMETVRGRARAVLGAPDGRLLFVSGATEGIQTAVLSALRSLRERHEQGTLSPQLLVYGATEHKAVPESIAHWNRLLGLNLELRALPVDAQGKHDLSVLAAWLPDVALLCTMAANNETGVVSDLAAIETLLLQRQSAALWLVDGVQALGKLPLALGGSRIDYAPFSGHKLYAPKGIGLLYVREGAPFTPLMVGGGQEGGARAGTENMPGIAALGAVLAALQRGDTFRSHSVLQGYRDRLQASLEVAFPGVVFNAPREGSLPTTLNFSVPGVSSQTLLEALDAAGVRVSAGSACSAAKAVPTYVLQAMGLPAWRAASAVRLSLGALADEALVDRACDALRACGLALRAGSQDRDLDADRLRSLVAAWPDAQLLDVREPHERPAGVAMSLDGRAVQSAPLSQLSAFLPDWLQALERDAPPLVFICQSGARSLKAVQCLQRHGYGRVHHLAGGLARHPDALIPLIRAGIS